MWVGIRLWIIAVGLFTLPGSLDPFWRPKAWLFLLGMLILTASRYKQVRIAVTPVPWLIAYIAILFSWQFMSKPAFLTPENRTIIWNMSLLLPFLVTFASLIVAMKWIEGFAPQELIFPISACCCLAGIIALHSLAQAIGMTQWLSSEDVGRSAIFSTLGNRMLVGNLLAITAPLFLIFKRGWIGMLLCTGVTILVYNRAGMLALLVSSFLFLILHQKGYKQVVFGVIAIISAWCLFLHFSFSNGHLLDGHRLVMWQETWNYFLQNNMAITGYGLGSLESIFRQAGTQHILHASTFHHPHNEFLLILFELGPIGSAIILWGLLSLFIRIFRSKKNLMMVCLLCSFVNILIISLFSFPLHVAPIALIALIVWVGLEITTHNNGVTYVSA